MVDSAPESYLSPNAKAQFFRSLADSFPEVWPYIVMADSFPEACAVPIYEPIKLLLSAVDRGYVGHNYEGHNYIGHDYMGHDYI